MTTRYSWLPHDLPLLDDRFPLPLDRPFSTREAANVGIGHATLKLLVARNLVRPVLHGVYAAAQVRDSIESRADALKLVVPDSAVITDRTAAWLHGVDLLPPSALSSCPPIEVFDRAGSRVRRAGVTSGRRRMRDEDVMVVEGLLVTTKLRTAMDLGRRLYPPLALAALDAMLRIGVDHERLLGSVERFRGERGVVQLRALAPLADPRPESPPESVMRWHWLMAGLPSPEPQVWVRDEFGRDRFRIDLGNEEVRYGAEYFGARFHGDSEAPRDQERLDWLDHTGDWEIDVFTNVDLFPRHADPGLRMRQGLARARRRHAKWKPQGQFLTM